MLCLINMSHGCHVFIYIPVCCLLLFVVLLLLYLLSLPIMFSSLLSPFIFDYYSYYYQYIYIDYSTHIISTVAGAYVMTCLI